jgi:deazaflavin-dependent oxidoreductase (nitroreductase family)
MTKEPATVSTGKPPPHWLVKAMARSHVLLHRLTGGRLLNSFRGDDVCFVTMKGARSGRMLTIPLMYVPYRDGVLLVASRGGAPTNPVWHHNLVKHPEIVVSHRRHRMKLRARLAEPEEWPQLWRICDQHYPPTRITASARPGTYPSSSASPHLENARRPPGGTLRCTTDPGHRTGPATGAADPASPPARAVHEPPSSVP